MNLSGKLPENTSLFEIRYSYHPKDERYATNVNALVVARNAVDAIKLTLAQQLETIEIHSLQRRHCWGQRNVLLIDPSLIQNLLP